MRIEHISHARLLEVLAYDPLSGAFRWRVSQGRAVVGAIAECVEAKGYIRIMVDGRRYKAHVLAWYHVTGDWPEFQIDHRDGDPSNNRFANFRPATNALNCANQSRPKNNTTGFKGVSRSKSGRFVAGIKINYRRVQIGTFDTAEEAAHAYGVAAQTAWGSFARCHERKAA